MPTLLIWVSTAVACQPLACNQGDDDAALDKKMADMHTSVVINLTVK